MEFSSYIEILEIECNEILTKLIPIDKKTT
jgi:hypothetical protein